MDLNMSNLDTLVAEGPYCMFCATRRQIYWGLTNNVAFCYFFDLILHTHKQRHTTHAGAKRLTHPHKYILTPAVTCSQLLSALHWINNSLMSKIYFTEFHNVFTFQKLLTWRSHISVD